MIKTPSNRIFATFLTLIFLAFQAELLAQKNGSDKLILIHVDGLSLSHVMEEAEQGNLPNLMSYFGQEGIIKNTVTYFPSKTPTVISSVKDGVTPENAALAGWIQTDESGSGVKGMVSTFLTMAFSTPRMATTNLIYGIPLLDNLAGPAMQNIPTYLRDYDVIQFFWYKTDTHAHFYGEKAYIKQLRVFDRDFGKLTNRLPSNVNIIIYSDHGLTFGKGVELGDDVDEIIGDDLLAYSFPTLYLKHLDNVEIHARNLVDQTPIAVTFYKSGNQKVTGIHENGEFFFKEENGTVQYSFTGEDFLGYTQFGYDGSGLDVDDWLRLTYKSDYPMAPVNIYYFMQNRSAGDIITLLNPDEYNQTGYSSKSNHGGFHRADMISPMFIKGDAVESLRGRDYFWLPNLFKELDEFEVDAEPNRDRHYLSSSYNLRSGKAVTELAISPTYRVYYGANLYWDRELDRDQIDVWGQVDIFRTFLSRLWVGGGVEIDTENKFSPFLKLRYDFHLRKLIIQNFYSTNRDFQVRLSYEVTSAVAFELTNFRSLGLRIDF